MRTLTSLIVVEFHRNASRILNSLRGRIHRFLSRKLIIHNTTLRLSSNK